jgi:hypothetical protein
MRNKKLSHLFTPFYRIGLDTETNDRQLYTWICIKKKDTRIYWITMFYNEVDSNTGNFHTQFGRIRFVKGIKKNRKRRCSPNDLLESSENSIALSYHQNRWVDPLCCLKDSSKEAERKKCLNGRWLTVDDVNHRPEVASLIAEAFLKFVGKDEEPIEP